MGYSAAAFVKGSPTPFCGLWLAGLPSTVAPKGVDSNLLKLANHCNRDRHFQLQYMLGSPREIFKCRFVQRVWGRPKMLHFLVSSKTVSLSDPRPLCLV